MSTTEITRAPTTFRRWAALAVLMLPVLLVSIDNTVLSFALPHIARDLRPTAAAQLWIVDAYPLVLAGLLVAMGNLGDRFGRRRMLMIGSVGFGVVSIFAAFAPDAAWLIAARVLLGFFGAMLMPSTLSLLRTTFTDRRERPSPSGPPGSRRGRPSAPSSADCCSSTSGGGRPSSWPFRCCCRC
jgi:DHA2 family multidrug resistance protein-like MFS transporter